MSRGFSRRLASQLANPSGMAGRVLGRAMDVVNREPLRLSIDLLGPRNGESILDAGCGTGAAMAAMLRRANCRVIGADISSTMIGAARRRLGLWAEYVHSPLEDLALPERSFDAILAMNVLYFDGAEHGILRRLFRLLRPDGRLVAYVTHRSSMEQWAFAREGLHRLYDAQELREAFCRSGFERNCIEVHEVPITSSVTGLLVRGRR